jgi:hypothetical protein
LKTTGITHVELDTKLYVYSVSTCGREGGREGGGRERERERGGEGEGGERGEGGRESISLWVC